MDEQKDAENWRENITEPKPTLKIQPDTEVILTFQDEGRKNVSVDYGTSIVFGVKVLDSDEVKDWYVNEQNYNLLRQIKALGKLKDLKAKVKRQGSKRSDTRYTIEKA